MWIPSVSLPRGFLQQQDKKEKRFQPENAF
jgi:hypothetical protein